MLVAETTAQQSYINELENELKERKPITEVNDKTDPDTETSRPAKLDLATTITQTTTKTPKPKDGIEKAVFKRRRSKPAHNSEKVSPVLSKSSEGRPSGRNDGSASKTFSGSRRRSQITSGLSDKRSTRDVHVKHTGGSHLWKTKIASDDYDE